MMHWGNDFGMGFGGGWIFMIIFWGLIILGIIFLVKLIIGGESTREKKSDSAEEVLKKRFASGEISKEEYEEALEILKRA